MKKAKYGVLLVTGMRTHQENYGAAFAADERCRIVAVTDEPNVSKYRRFWNEQLAKELNVPYIADLGEALKRKDVDITSICAPPERRARVAVRCAEAGKHLYLDKSLAPSLEEAEAILQAVKKAGVKSHMFCFITQPWAQEAKRFVEEGRLGKLIALHADTFFAKGKTGTAKLGKRRQEEFPPKRHQLRQAKREFDNVGVYPVTLIHWLTGKRFQTVFGITGNYFFQEHQKNDVEDFGLVNATLEDNTNVTVAAGRYGWNTHPSFGVNRILLVGTKQTLLIDAHRPRLEIYTDAPPWTPPKVHPDDPMGFWSSTQKASGVKPKWTWTRIDDAGKSDASYFVDCIETGKESEMSIVQAVHSAEVLVATYLSAHKGEVVRLPLPRG
ncbi:MAG: dehydrogenase [Gemmatales bacterium]|nr:MAG: dehydrogenase [Gemmatales bacterium]